MAGVELEEIKEDFNPRSHEGSDNKEFIYHYISF